MTETVNKSEIAEAVNASAPTGEPVIKKDKNKSKAATRKVKDLENVSVKNMTEAEKDLYIKSLRLEVTKFAKQAQAYKESAESAFKELHTLIEKTKKLKDTINRRDIKLKQALDVFMDFINQYLKIEE